MGFALEFNSVCKFKDQTELNQLLKTGTGVMTKTGARAFPTGQWVIAYGPDNTALAVVEVRGFGLALEDQQTVTRVVLKLVRLLTEEESRVQTALAKELFFERR